MLNPKVISILDYLIILGIFLLPIFNLQSLENPPLGSGMFLIYLLAIIALIKLFFSNPIQLPEIKISIKKFSLMIIIVYLLYTLLTKPAFFLLDTWHQRISMVVLVLYFYNFQTKPHLVTAFFIGQMASQITVILFGLKQVNLQLAESGSSLVFSNIEGLASYFPYRNLAAEFLLFNSAILLNLYPRINSPYRSILNIFFVSIQMFSFFYISLSGNRSAFIGIALILFYALFSYSKKFLLIAIPIVLISTFMLTRNQIQQVNKNLFNLFSGSTSNRIQILRESLKLIPLHPMGIGNQDYSFELARVSKIAVTLNPIGVHIFYRTPHNEFLRLILEEGIIGFILIIALLTYIFWNKSIWMNSNTIILITPLFIELLFQFPLITPFGILFTCFILSQLGPSPSAIKIKIPPLPCILLILYLFSGLMIQNAKATYGSSFQLLTKYFKPIINADPYLNYIFLNSLTFFSEEPNNFISEALVAHKRFPYYSPITLLLTQYYFANDDIETGCEFYAKILQGTIKESLERMYQDVCKGE